MFYKRLNEKKVQSLKVLVGSSAATLQTNIDASERSEDTAPPASCVAPVAVRHNTVEESVNVVLPAPSMVQVWLRHAIEFAVSEATFDAGEYLTL